MYKPSREEEDVAYKILGFYQDKNNNDHEQTNKELDSLRITDINVDRGEVNIHLARPGLIIGAKGKNIDALQERLGMKVNIFESFDWSNILHSEEPYDRFDRW